MKSTILIILVTFALTGCNFWSKKPVIAVAPFPAPPAELLVIPQVMQPIPHTSTDINDSSISDVKLSTISKIIINNYTTCNKNSAQLTSLQEWVNDHLKLNTAKE